MIQLALRNCYHLTVNAFIRTWKSREVFGLPSTTVLNNIATVMYLLRYHKFLCGFPSAFVNKSRVKNSECRIFLQQALLIFWSLDLSSSEFFNCLLTCPIPAWYIWFSLLTDQRNNMDWFRL